MGYVCFVLFDCCLVVWFDFGLVVGCFVLVIDLICWFAEVVLVQLCGCRVVGLRLVF